MQESYFPEDKDLAHKIMMELNNADLVKLCATNKRMYSICNNYPSFWQNKFIKDYGELAARYKPADRSWKNHYMTVFIDLEKYNKYPILFLRNIAWKHDLGGSWYIDAKNRKFIPLIESPEWVMNNLYLLNIPNIKTIDEQGNTAEYENIKPIELLKRQQQRAISYLNGFSKMPNDYYRPYYATLGAIETWAFDLE